MSTPTLSAKVERSVSLYLRSGTSDKEYHLYLCKHSDGTYSVHAEYGRRDKPNQRHDKTASGRVSSASARVLFDDTENEKRREGYRNMADPRPPAKIPGAVAVAPDVRPPALARAFEAYLKTSPEVAEASKLALETLEARTGAAKLRALSAEVRCVLGAVLGDIACSSQDYVDDALLMVSRTLSGTGLGAAALLSELSAAAVAALEAARAAAAPADTPEQFFDAALQPVRTGRVL